MYLIFLDSETSGLNPEKHRLLEIAYKVVDSKSGSTILSYESIISQPAEVWAEADGASLEVTGFCWEDILMGKSERAVASEIINDLNCLGIGEKGGVFVCQNPSFDRTFFLQLINADLQRHYGWPYHWLDLASMYWAFCLLQEEGRFKEWKESDLSKDAIAKHFALREEKYPHRAMKGVNHLLACYNALFKVAYVPTDTH